MKLSELAKQITDYIAEKGDVDVKTICFNNGDKFVKVSMYDFKGEKRDVDVKVIGTSEDCHVKTREPALNIDVFGKQTIILL